MMLWRNRTGTSVDNGARIKNTHKIVEINSCPDYSSSYRVLKWRSRSVAKSAYQTPGTQNSLQHVSKTHLTYKDLFLLTNNTKIAGRIHD